MASKRMVRRENKRIRLQRLAEKRATLSSAIE